MVGNPLITEELMGKTGVEWEPREYEVERGMIKRFAQAIDDQNPLWQDEEYAHKSKYGSIIAPPTFITILGFDQLMEEILTLASFRTILHGKTELECYQPIRPREIISVTTKITDIRQRQGKVGKVVFITFDTTYKNQREELVAKCQQMVIGY